MSEPSHSFDYIIVGQGIAGTMMAHFLLEANQKVLVLDKLNLKSASHIASGVMNPVTGKRMVKSWRAGELIPFAVKTYQDLEQQLGVELLYQKNIVKFFSNPEDVQFYQEKKEKGEIEEYVREADKSLIDRSSINDTLGAVEISGTNRLDYHQLLVAYREYLLERGSLVDEDCDYDLLEIDENGVRYKNWPASKIIFCEGAKAIDNPYFSWLPFNLAKGELLTVRIPGLNQERIWKKGLFMLPLGDSLFLVGSTYEWNYEHGLPTEAKKLDLLKRLEKAISLPYEVVDHNAAVRPTIKDRRPVIGFHPEHPALVMFNGMGTKGASLTPLLAKQLTEHLLEGVPLNEEVDVQRFPIDGNN